MKGCLQPQSVSGEEEEADEHIGAKVQEDDPSSHNS